MVREHETGNAGELATLLDRLVMHLQRTESQSFPVDLLGDVTLHEAHVLKAIPIDGIRMSDLAREIGISSASMTVAIDRLEKKNYVSRIRNHKDRRVVTVSLKDPGKAINAEHDRVHKQMAERIMKNLSPEDQVATVESLRHIIRSLDLTSPPAPEVSPERDDEDQVE